MDSLSLTPSARLMSANTSCSCLQLKLAGEFLLGVTILPHSSPPRHLRFGTWACELVILVIDSDTVPDSTSVIWSTRERDFSQLVTSGIKIAAAG